MYEEHNIKCTSCGKVFFSELNDTLCSECFDKTTNRIKPLADYVNNETKTQSKD